MELTSHLVVILAMVVCGNQAHIMLSGHDAMQCLMQRNSDDRDSCLLGGKETICKTFKCFQTVAMPCSPDHEHRITGKECAKSLICGCDKKCNGCMNVNGLEKCHWAECMPFIGKAGKRSQIAESNSMDNSDVRNYDFPSADDSMTV